MKKIVFFVLIALLTACSAPAAFTPTPVVESVPGLVSTSTPTIAPPTATVTLTATPQLAIDLVWSQLTEEQQHILGNEYLKERVEVTDKEISVAGAVFYDMVDGKWVEREEVMGGLRITPARFVDGLVKPEDAEGLTEAVRRVMYTINIEAENHNFRAKYPSFDAFDSACNAGPIEGMWWVYPKIDPVTKQLVGFVYPLDKPVDCSIIDLDVPLLSKDVILHSSLAKQGESELLPWRASRGAMKTEFEDTNGDGVLEMKIQIARFMIDDVKNLGLLSMMEGQNPDQIQAALTQLLADFASISLIGDMVKASGDYALRHTAEGDFLSITPWWSSFGLEGGTAEYYMLPTNPDMLESTDPEDVTWLAEHFTAQQIERLREVLGVWTEVR